MQQSDIEWFKQHPTQFCAVAGSNIAYRVIGQGDPVLLVHGWPFNSLTYAPLARHLADHYTCYIPDLPGSGQTKCSLQTDYTFPAQAQTLKAFTTALGLRQYDVVAHDTGASISRLLAVADPDHLRKLVLFNTEIPGQRPPDIPLVKALMKLPFSAEIFRFFFSLDALYKHSFRNVFYDRALLSGAFKANVITPQLTDLTAMRGLVRYLRGLEWSVIDGLRDVHSQLQQPTLLIWGADDPTFPLSHAREMSTQFANLDGFIEIPQAKLLVYIERAAEVALHILRFLQHDNR